MNPMASIRSVACSAALLAAGAANAIPFQIAGGSASTSGVSVGSTVTATPSAGLAQTFDLQAGQTTSPFAFLDVTVTGKGAVAGYINAQLNFAQPIVTSASGILAGFSVILGWTSGGSLWVVNDPGAIAFGNGGSFDVNFYGFSSTCSLCTTLSGTVTATISLLRAPGSTTTPPTSVPEPSTLWLLGAGLLAIGVTVRRRRVG